MATRELKRFRVECDWRHDARCAICIVVDDVADRYEAEASAAEQGWRVGLSTSCGHCEDMWQQVQKAKGISDE